MDPATDETLVDLTLRDAAELYDVTVKTLALHLRCGRLAGYKGRGAAGREWRVTRDALDDAGYRPRARHIGVGASEDDEPARLRRHLAAAQRSASAERRRADDLDRRLGHAMLECGRLRAALAAATGEQDEMTPALDQGAARWLMDAIRSGATPTRNPQASTRA